MTDHHIQLQEELGKVPEEYVPALIKIVKAFREGVTLLPAEETFRQGWQETQSGQTYPIADLWDEDDA